jgi:NitT/TauT family transport system substrate-binding protein
VTTTPIVTPAAAQQPLRISYQYGLGFLPVTVVLEQKLIEKHAKAAGLPDIAVSGLQISGAATTNDALLSGSIEIASGGIGGLLQMWDKTGGRVKGLVAVNDMAFFLNTNDPNVKTLADYLNASGHKIALPAVKVGAHAIVLSMAAEKSFGTGKQDALDSLTMSLSHPDAFAALRSGRSEIRSHFASLPFSVQELGLKDVRTVLNSYDVFGGPHNNTLLYTADKWQSENPKLAKAVFDAFVEAEAWITANPKAAAELFKSTSKSPLDVAEIEAIIKDKKLTQYAPEPKATMQYADFLYKIKRIKTKPTSWKDYFWPVAHQLSGD